MKYFFYGISVFLIVIGLLYIVSCLNLLTIGYNFMEYVHFITREIHFYCVIVGIFLLVLTLWIGG